MSQYKESINKHYTREDLGKAILAAYESAGKDTDSLTREDISSFEEFHIRGRMATRELGRLAGLTEGMKVLDIGSGVGGPARTLAAEFGCEVVGLDMVEEYNNTAEMLTRKVGLSDKVTFRTGNMLDLPFEGSTFNVVWSQHVTMNIEDKQRLFREIRRVLKPDGIFVCYEIIGGTTTPIHFPVPWAGDSTINFLVNTEELRPMLKNAGFEELVWKDVSAASLEWGRGLISSMSSRPKDAPPPLGLNLLMGKTTAPKVRNMVLNMEEDRVKVVQAVFKNSG